MNRTRRGHTRRGFTLVELGAVVAIIGILSVIALVSYRKYILYSKITEAKSVISAIKVAQEDYRSEKGTYAKLGTSFCPGAAVAGGGKFLVGWDPACSGGVATWQTLAVHVSGAVLFKYATDSGNAAYVDNFTHAPGWVAVTGTANIQAPWYAVDAQCDLDGAGGNNTELFSSSYDNQIFSVNDGQ